LTFIGLLTNPTFHEGSLNPNHVVSVGFIAATSLLIILNVNSCFAIEYSNYTSEKYRIQFQYRSNWNVTEKTGRFDENSDIEITSPTHIDAFVTISYMLSSAMPDSSLAFQSLVTYVFNDMSGYDVNQERKSIEEPAFMTINGKQAGTFLFTSKDKYDKSAKTYGDQVWMVNNLDHGYTISFLAIKDSFDSPENIDIRDRFIKSIKFL
jgi:hypothetical protein